MGQYYNKAWSLAAVENTKAEFDFTVNERLKKRRLCCLLFFSLFCFK
jgi:hypothetical protein